MPAQPGVESISSFGRALKNVFTRAGDRRSVSQQKKITEVSDLGDGNAGACPQNDSQSLRITDVAIHHQRAGSC